MGPRKTLDWDGYRPAGMDIEQVRDATSKAHIAGTMWAFRLASGRVSKLRLTDGTFIPIVKPGDMGAAQSGPDGLGPASFSLESSSKTTPAIVSWSTVVSIAPDPNRALGLERDGARPPGNAQHGFVGVEYQREGLLVEDLAEACCVSIKGACSRRAGYRNKCDDFCRTED
jgi:hypothetical protein